MGKATKWLMAVLGLKRQEPPSWSHREPAATPSRIKEKQRRWGFVKSYREKGRHPFVPSSERHVSYEQEISSSSSCSASQHHPERHAVAVAAATAAAAEAAVAAAHAAAAVVRLASSGRSVASRGGAVEFELAVVKIQSCFRGYLARKALRALKALVKLQALVRGYIERKRTKEWLYRMQSLLRAQERARAERYIMHQDSSHHFYLNPSVSDYTLQTSRIGSGKHDHSPVMKVLYLVNFSIRNSQILCTQKTPTKIRSSALEDERNDKVLEIDTGKYYSTSKRGNHLLHSGHYPFFSQNLTPTESAIEEDEYWSKKSPFTPTKSDGARSFLGGYSDHPSYMSNTQSSKAKARSLSAPKQRPHYERSSSGKRNSIEARCNSPQKGGSVRVSLNRGYPGSGRLDSQGMPIGRRY